MMNNVQGNMVKAVNSKLDKRNHKEFRKQRKNPAKKRWLEQS